MGCADRLNCSIRLPRAVTDGPLVPDQHDRCRARVSADQALDPPGAAN